MDNIKKVPTQLGHLKENTHTQLDLFQIINFEDNQYSNTIELYDAIPKYTWGRPKRDKTGKLDILERSFVHKGKKYNVLIQPVRVKMKDGSYKDFLPSKREELVEDALRKLACSGSGVFIDDSVGVGFTLYELQKELKRMGHSYNITEIKEAILICAKTNIELQSADGTSIMIANVFEAVGLQTKEDWKKHGKKTKAYIRFNPLVTQSIKNKTFRLFNYDKSMSYSNSYARWLHKRLSHNYVQASLADPYGIKLSSIIRDSGMKRYASLSDNMKHIKAALQEMIGKNVLISFEPISIREGRKIVDASYTMVPHPEFIKEVKYSNMRLRDAREEENRIAVVSGLEEVRKNLR